MIKLESFNKKTSSGKMTTKAVKLDLQEAGVFTVAKKSLKKASHYVEIEADTNLLESGTYYGLEIVGDSVLYKNGKGKVLKFKIDFYKTKEDHVSTQTKAIKVYFDIATREEV